MKPMWAEIEEEIPELASEYYEADDNPEILKKYSVSDVPAFIFLDKEGTEILRLQGLQSKEELVKIVKENLDK